MLRELSVQNLALIADVRLELPPGFCAWTGETGAGKTLLLSALGLLTGERGSADLIRNGAEELRITGRFEVGTEVRSEVAEILGLSGEEDEVVLTRRLTRAGRSYAYANEQPVSVATLRGVGALLVDIHGQRESHSLLQPAYQLLLLDSFGGLDALREAYDLAAEALRALRRRHTTLSTERQSRLRELALLRFERDELDAAQLRSGEYPELARERERLAHAQSLQEFAARAGAQLHEADGSVDEQLGRLAREAESWQHLDPALAEVTRRLAGLQAEVQDLADTLRHLSGRWEADPARLEEAERRLQQLRRLEVKYGRKADELIDYRASLDEQEQRLAQQETDLSGIEAEMGRCYQEVRSAAAALSEARAKVARRLTTEAQRHLADLGMAEAKLDAALETTPLGPEPRTAELPTQGADTLELLLAANRGEPARPLRKVASGGELSRTLLALKTVLAAHDHLGTLVFDEIDANVGGRLGDVLGQKLAALGRTHQVICVTHLPQVASYARHQWTIRKVRQGRRTTTMVELLGEAERLEELASMLRGESRGETTRKEAAAMLEAARKRW